MTIETNAWVHPKTGQTRHYINGFWEDMLGLHLEYYNTGNISYASIDGEKIANGRARKLSGKLWADETGKLHLDGFYGSHVYSQAEALERITKYIADNGGLDFLAAPAEEAEQAQAEPEVEAVKFSGSLTDEEVAIIEAAAAGPLYKYDTPKEAATEAAGEIAKKYGVNLLEIYNAYLKAKGQRTWPVFTPASRHFGLLFEA